MTNSQEKVIEQVRKSIPRFDFYGSDDYEIKEFEVDESYFDEIGIIFVYIVTGLIGDEGTYAEFFCRKRRQFSIGKRGGITNMTGRKGDKYYFKHVNLFTLMNECHED